MAKSGAILYLKPHTNTRSDLLNGTIHSLVDNLRMKNRCDKKEGFTLRHCYVTIVCVNMHWG